MNGWAIKADRVGKVFKIYNKPFDRVKEVLLRKKLGREFVALRDVSFSLRSGEVLGIIGNNGSGKSTLLKIIAGVLKPSEGSVEVAGSVAALLELGIGFHPEFTGRQNIFVNGMLLGLKEEEVREKEEEIIEFAELGDFIDQPVKTYSSGMYMRLAFSIATSVDPDILIIDEALSVGDQRFQSKCIKKILGFKDKGKTILFCSHSMYHIYELCEQVMWLHKGKIHEMGDVKDVVRRYEDWMGRSSLEDDVASQEGMIADKRDVWVESVKIYCDNQGGKRGVVCTGDDVRVVIKIKTNESRRVHVGVGFKSSRVRDLFGITTKGEGLEPYEIVNERSVEVVFPKIPLLNGWYQAFGVALDESGLQIYDLKLSDEFRVRGPSGIYGWFLMERRWES